MPLANLPKNCFHYWVLCGASMGYWINKPGFTGSLDLLALFSGKDLVNQSTAVLAGLMAVWAFAQVSNFITHCTLRNLRAPGSKERKIPYGYGFDLVSCPNYTFECLGWLVTCLLTGSLSAWLFFIVGTGQMYLWARKKHSRYAKEFGKKYARLGRRVLVPYIL